MLKFSFGATRTARQGLLTVHMANRFERESSIWQIAGELKAELERMPELGLVDVYE